MATLQPGLACCGQTLRFLTLWLLFSSTTRGQGRAPLCLNPPNEEMHYDVISFGPAEKLLWITEQSE